MALASPRPHQLLALVALVVLAAPCAAADSDLAVLASNEAAALLPTSPSSSAAAAAQASATYSLLGDDDLFPDLVASGAYNTSDQRVVWPAATHVSRAKAMALAAADPRGPQHLNGTLLRGADRALQSWARLNLENANWWYNQIGVPMAMADALLLMQHAAYDVGAAGGALDACNGCRSCLNQAHAGAMTGANLVWLTHIAMQNALLRGNGTRVGECFDLIYAEVCRSPLGCRSLHVLTHSRTARNTNAF